MSPFEFNLADSGKVCLKSHNRIKMWKTFPHFFFLLFSFFPISWCYTFLIFSYLFWKIIRAEIWKWHGKLPNLCNFLHLSCGRSHLCTFHAVVEVSRWGKFMDFPSLQWMYHLISSSVAFFKMTFFLLMHIW